MWLTGNYFIVHTLGEKTPSNKTPALAKRMNMDTWVVNTLNQLFIRLSKTETKLWTKVK